MITSVGLHRFRGYRSAHLQLRPLTVLLGPNSAGKSSFLHALAALHFIRRLRLSPATLSPVGVNFSSWPFDFGTRETLQFHDTRSEGGIRIELGFSEGDTNAEIAYEFGRATGGDSLDLSALEIRDQTKAATVTQHGVHPATTYTVTAPVASESSGSSPHEHEPNAIAIREVGPGFWQGPRGEAVVLTLKNLELEYYGRRTGTLIEVQSKGQKRFLEALDRMRYLRPSRAAPRRRAEARPPTLPEDDVGPDGEWTGETWLSHRRAVAEFQAPPPSRIDRETAVQLLAGREPPVEGIAFDEAVDRWMTHLGVAKGVQAERIAEAVSVTVDVDGNHRGLPDVGFGVSQVLPIIVQGLSLPEGGTLLVEQPEAQLHPRPQAQLADFFCAMIRRGRSCIVETHSESFFRRLHLRALLDERLAANIAVYFVDPVAPTGCSDPVPVPLNVDEGVRWPKAFLSESTRAHAAFAAVRAAIAQRDTKRSGD